MKILVRNIALSVNEKELSAEFEGYGKVQYCKIVDDKGADSHKGFGFVEMPRPGDAKAAIKNLNGKDLKGMILRVKKAEPKVAAQARPDPWAKSVSVGTTEKKNDD